MLGGEEPDKRRHVLAVDVATLAWLLGGAGLARDVVSLHRGRHACAALHHFGHHGAHGGSSF